jgi:hypothetical protein
MHSVGVPPGCPILLILCYDLTDEQLVHEDLIVAHGYFIVPIEEEHHTSRKHGLKNFVSRRVRKNARKASREEIVADFRILERNVKNG